MPGSGASSRRRVIVGNPALNEARGISKRAFVASWDDPWDAGGYGRDCRRRAAATGPGMWFRLLLDEFPNLRLMANPKRLQAAAMNLIASEAGVAEAARIPGALRCPRDLSPPATCGPRSSGLHGLAGDVAAVATVGWTRKAVAASGARRPGP